MPTLLLGQKGEQQLLKGNDRLFKVEAFTDEFFPPSQNHAIEPYTKSACQSGDALTIYYAKRNHN